MKTLQKRESLDEPRLRRTEISLSVPECSRPAASLECPRIGVFPGHSEVSSGMRRSFSQRNP